jgi:uncharacterized protein YbjT (DUF2867 family)
LKDNQKTGTNLMLRVFILFCLSFLLFACNNNSESQSSKDITTSVKKPGKLILVTGITGRQGGAVAHALLDKGYRLRGLSRNPQSDRSLAMSALGVKMLKGDFNDAASLDKTMEDVYGVYSMTNYWEHGYEAEVQQGKNVADAAFRANVKHLVFSSVANADQATSIPHFDSKYEIEQYIQSLDIPYTILRPVSFMENWEYSREKIIAGKIHSPFSLSTRMQQISVRDIGRFAALAFSDPDNWLGRTIDIAGEEYTMKEVVNLFSRITGSPVEFVQIPWDDFEKKAGEEMTVMDRWIENTGYSANINLVRSQLKDMLTLEDYLHEAKW